MKRESKRVAILTPCDDSVKTEFALSLSNLILHTLTREDPGLEGITVQFYGSSILPHSRERLCELAISADSTHTLWIDSDMRFPPDMLCRFLRHDESLVGINAMSRREPYRCLAQSAPRVALETKPESTGLEKVYRTGFGVMWVATQVLKDMKPPRFDFEYIEGESVWRGEDYVFFRKATEMGHSIYVDHDISKEVFHMGSMGFNPLLAGMKGA
jgi:hypothetical protein